ncbi:Aldehyde dehydrogenase protein [Pseudomonas savastanoi]|uniref:Aldehyde dehydrogenase protein n=1 Tax=Pseudomonas savastanoi TaxID=29438 RepID=A0A3M6AD71_PSESS|nr:Aldehyde dehydrogenase protein [Pseudomonas savastanoi]
MTSQSLNSHRVDPDTAQKFYIDGRWSAPLNPASIAVINPATEEVVAHVASGSAADVDRMTARLQRRGQPLRAGPAPLRTPGPR